MGAPAGARHPPGGPSAAPFSARARVRSGMPERRPRARGTHRGMPGHGCTRGLDGVDQRRPGLSEICAEPRLAERLGERRGRGAWPAPLEAARTERPALSYVPGWSCDRAGSSHRPCRGRHRLGYGAGGELSRATARHGVLVRDDHRPFADRDRVATDADRCGATPFAVGFDVQQARATHLDSLLGDP